MRLINKSIYIHSKDTAYRILAGEIGAAVLIALLFLVLVDKVAAYSALLGGIAFILPNLFFIRFALRHPADESAKLALRWFFIGEAVKITSTIVIFGACLIWIKPLSIGVMFAAYGLILLLNIFALAKKL